jgi:hypothetical protein
MVYTVLALDSRSDDVRRLQEGLLALNYPVSDAEVGEAVFGAGTQAAVRELQALAGLEPTGVFDDDAAQALARAQAAAAYPSPRVAGRLRTDLAAPAADAAVRLYRHAPDGEVVLVGEATTDADGLYRIDYDAEPDAASALEVRMVAARSWTWPPRGDRSNRAGDRRACAGGVRPAVRRRRPSLRRVRHPAARCHRARRAEPRHRRGPRRRAPGRPAGTPASLAVGAVAGSLADASGLDVRGVSALIRHGLPAEREQLAAVPPESVHTALTQAALAGVVSLDPAEIDTFTGDFTAFAERTRLAGRPAGALSTYGDFLANTGLDRRSRPLSTALWSSTPATRAVCGRPHGQEASTTPESPCCRRRGSLAAHDTESAPDRRADRRGAGAGSGRGSPGAGPGRPASS